MAVFVVRSSTWSGLVTGWLSVWAKSGGRVDPAGAELDQSLTRVHGHLGLGVSDRRWGTVARC